MVAVCDAFGTSAESGLTTALVLSEVDGAVLVPLLTVDMEVNVGVLVPLSTVHTEVDILAPLLTWLVDREVDAPVLAPLPSVGVKEG